MVVLGTTIHESACRQTENRTWKLVDGPPTNVGPRRQTKSDHDGGSVCKASDYAVGLPTVARLNRLLRSAAVSSRSRPVGSEASVTIISGERTPPGLVWP